MIAVLKRDVVSIRNWRFNNPFSPSPPPPPEVILTVLPRASLTRTIRLYDQLCLYCYIVRNWSLVRTKDWQYIYKWRFVFFVFSAVKHRGNNVNPASVKQALMASARRLPGFNIFEQGTCEKIKVCKGRNWNYRVIWYYQLSW